MSEIPAVSTSLPWQKEVWSHLVTQIGEQQLPHAMLLCGAQHSGKAHLAMTLARFLLCQQPEAGHNCGKCHACELSQSGSHGDFRWLAPEKDSRVIKVAQVRELVEFAFKTPSLGLRKVIVLTPAESMNTAAANALLKSLEEPSPETYIVLVCHRLQGLPATVRSRCQILRLPVPEREVSLAWLDLLTGTRSDSEKALVLARGQVFLADKMYRDASLDAAEAVKKTLESLETGQRSVQDLGILMANEPIDNLLSQLHEYLEQRIQNTPVVDRSSKLVRSTFGLLDDVIRLQRVVYSGANPNRQLLVDALSARFEMVLT